MCSIGNKVYINSLRPPRRMVQFLVNAFMEAFELEILNDVAKISN